jgi:hypothetical protein
MSCRKHAHFLFSGVFCQENNSSNKTSEQFVKWTQQFGGVQQYLQIRLFFFNFSHFFFSSTWEEKKKKSKNWNKKKGKMLTKLLLLTIIVVVFDALLVKRNKEGACE